jgi:chromosome segregation ATPase
MSKNRVIGQTARISKAKPATALHKFCQTASSSAIKLVERQKEVEREQELLENQIEAQKTRIAELEAREQTFTDDIETLNASKNVLVQRYDRLRAKAVSLKETVDFFITEHGLLKEYLSKNKEVTSSLKAEVAECIIRADASDKGLQVISNISGQLKTLRNDIAAELANSKYIFSHIPLQMD